MQGLNGNAQMHQNWQYETQTTKNINILDEVSNFIFKTKYARYNENEQRRENWNEAVERVESMHLKRFNYLPESDKKEIRSAFDMVRNKYVLPSMRSLQYAGIAIEANSLRSYNCAVRHIDSISAFSEVLYALLCGAGVGLGITNRFLTKMPNIIGNKKDTQDNFILVYKVKDTIEGWADALKILLYSYHDDNIFSGRYIQFDYTDIRKKGSRLKTSGGRAPGHFGVSQSLERIRFILEFAFKKRHKKLRTIDAYDILMHAADAVLSGGNRRSATSVMFDKDDDLMLNAKTGNWLETNPQRARSNNSITLERGKFTQEELEFVIKRTKEFGEPAFVFVDDVDMLFNPCYEIGFRPITKAGKTGMQTCNLTTMNGSKITSLDIYKECTKAAAIIGTLQASYTDFKYLSSEARELTEEEALLGVSITAMMDNPKILFNADYQNEAAKVAVDTNKIWANKIGINQAARVTCLKPEGTGTLALGSMASGIHPAHARKMFRRVQMNKMDAIFKFFKSHNPHLIEESVYSATGSDDVISFPIMLSDSVTVKKDLTALEHLEIIKSTQKNWVMSGATERNEKQLMHNISCTVQCEESDWSKVVAYIYKNQKFFTAVSFIASTGDKDYPQAPNQEVKNEEDSNLYDFFIDNYKSVNYDLLKEYEDITTIEDTVACGDGQCLI